MFTNVREVKNMSQLPPVRPKRTPTIATPVTSITRTDQETKVQKSLKIGMLLVLFAASFNLGIRWNEYQVGKWRGYLDNTIEQQRSEIIKKDRIIKTSREKLIRSNRAADRLLVSLKKRVKP